MLKREILDELVSWKNRPHHPLVIRGLRQIGKTYIVKQFGKEFYENTIYLDLRSNIALHEAFAGDFNVDEMILKISSVEKNARFIPGKTLYYSV